jgi:hypothetical protein
MTPAPVLLLAEVESTVLIRSLALAVVLVAPYGWYQVRRVRRRRAEREAAFRANEQPADAPTRPRLEDVVGDVEALAASLAPGGTGTITVPPEVTVGGSDVPSAVSDALVRDALRRSGLVATAEVDGPAGRTIECRRT